MRFIVFFLAFLSFLSAQAQVQGDCGTELDSATLARLSSTIAVRSTFVGQSRTVIEVPIQHFVFRTSSGNGGLTSGEIQDAMDALNANYLPIGIQFYECSAVRFVNSNTYYNYSQSQQSNLLATYYVNDVLNVYHFNSVTSSGGSGLCGYSDFPPGPDIVMMDGSCTVNGSTLSHEVGHYFSLLHTHSTSAGDEYVDGSNCTTAGDLLCDTPADPTLGNSIVNTSCVYTGTGLDPQGDPYQPDTRNLMSYSRKSCRNSFTQGQYSMVLYSVLNERDYLVCSTINTCNEPTNLLETYLDEDQCDAVWTAVPGATYEVKYRTAGSGWTVLTSTTPSISMTGLDCFTQYEWQVRSICIAGGASNWSSTSYFGTLPCTVQCSPPGGMQTDSIGVDNAILNWSDFSVASVYQVRYRVLGGSWTYDTVGVSQYPLIGLYCDTLYEWNVRSWCTNGSTSLWSTSNSFYTDACPVTTCSVPTGLATDSATTDMANVSWVAVIGVDYYELRYRETGLPSWISVTTADAFKLLSGLDCGTNYEWAVRAHCLSGDSSAWSSTQFFTTVACPCPPPNIPFAISPANGSIQTDSVQLVWSLDTCVASYDFELSYPNEPDFLSGASFSQPNYNTNTLLLTSQTGLVDNSDYYWRVKAHNAQGSSSFSPTYWFLYNPRAQGIVEANNLIYVGLYPNPSKGQVSLSIELRNREAVTLQVYNLLGQQVYAQQLGEIMGKANIDINLQHFTAGTYLLRLTTPSGSLARKFEVLE